MNFAQIIALGRGERRPYECRLAPFSIPFFGLAWLLLYEIQGAAEAALFGVDFFL
jgi:hypothetical protein